MMDIIYSGFAIRKCNMICKKKKKRDLNVLYSSTSQSVPTGFGVSVGLCECACVCVSPHSEHKHIIRRTCFIIASFSNEVVYREMKIEKLFPPH